MNCCLRNFRPGLLSLLLTRLILAAFLLSGCRQTPPVATPAPVTVTIAGSTEMRPLLIELTAAYSERNPLMLFSLRGGGSRLGEQWVASGRADIAASAAVYADAELPPDLARIPIGLDGIALIVHSDNPVDALTLAQIRDLYRGRALTWEGVGGRTDDVLLVSREDGSATRAFFERRVMGEERVARTAIVMPTSGDVVEYVAAHRAAIGYVTAAYLARNGESAAPVAQAVKAVSVEGRMPYGADLVEYRYPLARPLYMLIRQPADPTIQDIIDFALGAEGQIIVARYHVPVR